MLSYLLLPLLLVVLGFGILRSRHWTGFWALMFLYYAFFAVMFVAMLAMLLTGWTGRDPRLLAGTALEHWLLLAVTESGFEVLLIPVCFSLLPLGVAWLIIALGRMLRRLFYFAMPIMSRRVGQGEARTAAAQSPGQPPPTTPSPALPPSPS